jgi:excinuclease ABC subunit B
VTLLIAPLLALVLRAVSRRLRRLNLENQEMLAEMTRAVQEAHNTAHGIVPAGVTKSLDQVRFSTRVADARDGSNERDADRTRGKKQKKVAEAQRTYGTDDLPGLVTRLEDEMRTAAKNLDFETAARLRDELFDLKAAMGERAEKSPRARR